MWELWCWVSSAGAMDITCKGSGLVWMEDGDDDALVVLVGKWLLWLCNAWCTMLAP